MITVKAQKEYISKQTWYQEICLSNGLTTKGTVSISERMDRLPEIDFSNKSVLDIGCNSGGHCLWAKQRGARKVVGVDLSLDRISQARTLAKFEQTQINYYNKNFFNIDFKSKFDIVFCFAVITEIQDLIGALNKLKNLIGNIAYLEINLARPKIYVSSSRTWLRGFTGIKRHKAVVEIYQHKNGLTLSPTLEVLRLILGPDFKIRFIGKGVRYDLIEITRIV
jgi:2-polyprenyl-3-methyl-5-hydroxy-6-metoxy-1,4-benzoquinol methylase